MYDFSELVKIAEAIGSRADYVQGGGGNISVKIDDTNVMAIKASGFQINEVTQTSGYATVDYRRVADYHINADVSSGIDFEADSKRVTAECAISVEGIKPLRPSVEVGFHAVLEKCVIHTHSVYCNVFACCEQGRELVTKSLGDIPFIWVPYVTPGFFLTLEIYKEMCAYEKQHGVRPHVVFMQNHGLIVTHSDAEQCIQLHENVNKRLAEMLNAVAYPVPEVSDNKSNTSYIKEFFEKYPKSTLLDNILYPDQLVYLNTSIGEKFDLAGLAYNASEKEQRAMEETLLAYVYVMNYLYKNNYTVTVMTPEQINFICNWESEKYRKQLIK